MFEFICNPPFADRALNTWRNQSTLLSSRSIKSHSAVQGALGQAQLLLMVALERSTIVGPTPIMGHPLDAEKNRFITVDAISRTQLDPEQRELFLDNLKRFLK
ncbi:MAG: hypothetical protein VW738_03875, partial [Pseudomonadales bacterium]